jgi:16S rRNA G966 N2-methylase RsmD
MYNSTQLNVEHKTLSHPFLWRGQFTPELIDYFLDIHAKPHFLVGDPFSGSGTVLLECSKRGIHALSCEINPSAYAMSKFFEIGPLSFSEKWQLCQDINALTSAITLPQSPLYQKESASNYRLAYHNLIQFAQNTLQATMSQQKQVFLLNILFKMENYKKLTLDQAWHKAYNEISSFLFSLPESQAKISARLCDARQLDQAIARQLDLIITSPPYINVFNYHQNHRLIMELLDFDLLKVAQSELGANRKHRNNRFLTVIQYCLDMAQSLNAMYRALSQKGQAIMIIGRESNVKKTAFYNGELIKDLCQKTGIFRLIHQNERHFRNKFGTMIYEDILVLQPNTEVENTDEIARTVALAHLKDAMNRAPIESQDDLVKAINAVHKVTASPIFGEGSQK